MANSWRHLQRDYSNMTVLRKQKWVGASSKLGNIDGMSWRLPWGILVDSEDTSGGSIISASLITASWMWNDHSKSEDCEIFLFENIAQLHLAANEVEAEYVCSLFAITVCNISHLYQLHWLLNWWHDGITKMLLYNQLNHSDTTTSSTEPL